MPLWRSLGRDSAGARLIDHPAIPRQPFGLRLADVPFLTLGGLHDDERREFAAGHFFLTAAKLSDGRAVVLDEYALKWFDAKGALLGVSGRRGPGPGEFRTTRDLCVLRGDTVMAMESYGGRISLWTSTGNFIREYQRPSGFAPFNTCRSDGTLVVRGDEDGAVAAYRVIRPNGAEIARLGPIVTPRYTSPFMTEPHVLPVAQGYVVADARRYAYWIVDRTGRTRQIVRFGPPPPRMSESEWLEAAQRVFPGSRAAALRIARGDTLRTKPAFYAMLTDPNARVWIRDYDKPYGWTVFDAEGALVGRMLLNGAVGPLRREIVRVGADYAVVRRTGADGEVYLDFHGIVLPAR